MSLFPKNFDNLLKCSSRCMRRLNVFQRFYNTNSIFLLSFLSLFKGLPIKGDNFCVGILDTLIIFFRCRNIHESCQISSWFTQGTNTKWNRLAERAKCLWENGMIGAGNSLWERFQTKNAAMLRGNSNTASNIRPNPQYGTPCADDGTFSSRTSPDRPSRVPRVKSSSPEEIVCFNCHS